MRTSEEIYHRVRWDPRFDPARFVLGINVRGAAPKRVPLPAFVPGGDIPWHRVLFVEADGEVVWDRAAGVDRIDESAAGRARAARRLRAPFFTARTPYAWDPTGCWSPAPNAPEGRLPATQIRVLTWNTLWDRYDSDRIDTARRRPLLLAALEAADADVIALQEVETGLLAMLVAQPWVRAGYTLSTDPAGKDVDNGGVLLLSRLPVREAGWHALGPHKAVAAITVESAAGPLIIAATHLSSDHSVNGAQRRVAELALLRDGLAGVDGDVVLLGDFNDGGDGPVGVLGLRDAWTDVHGPGSQTPTFDPQVNPLAAVSSLSGRASRLDRVLLRGGELWAAGATLLGDAPSPDGLFISDHYAVAVDLTVGGERAHAGVLDVAPTVRTALAWIPPAGLWPPIQRVRQEHDPQIHRWPPHVNLLFGFVPESDFEQAAVLVADAVAQVAPFTAWLDGVRAFRHRDDATVWLDPASADPAPWAELHRELVRRFPRCRGRAEGYTPHLTLGRTRDPHRIGTDGLGGISAQVGELVLLSRRGGEPMQPRASVELGTGTVQWLSAPDAPSRTPPEPASLTRRLTEELAEGAVHIVGSRRLGCAIADADVDLVAALPGEPDPAQVASRVTAALPAAARVRQVTGARVPGLRMHVDDLDVDLVIVATGGIAPAEAVTRRAELGAAAAIALSAVSDADAVLAAVGGDQAAFAGLARSVKAWAKARGLDSAPHGGLPGLAWTIMAALTVRDLPPADLLRHFFGTWAAWDWHEPVALPGTPAITRPAEAPVVIMTPTEPVRSCTEQVGPGMRDLLTQELYQAWEIAEAGGDPVRAAPAAHRRHAAWAVLTVQPVRGEEFEVTLGRVRGRVRALLTALEAAGIGDVHAWPRPFEAEASLRRYAIGLGRTPPDAAQLARIADGWTRDLPGAGVAWADGGTIPTLR